MSFWSDKIAELSPAPAQRAPQGQWWQQAPAAVTATTAPAVSPPTAGPTSTAPADYRPAEAQSTTATERCPRCGSEAYAEIAVDMTMGGASHGGAALLAQTGGKVKRCFDCRYPSFDSSGDIIKGKGISAGGNDATRMNVRQQGNPSNGSWGPAVWDSAPLIV